ncbi:MAG: transposase [Promethearchaeota archaeon]
MNSHWTRDFLYHLTNHEGCIGDYFAICVSQESPVPLHVKVIERNKPRLEPYFDVILSPGQNALVRQDVVELEFKSARKAMISVEIDRIICMRPGLRQKIHNIASIPGISPFSAVWFIAEVGDVARFYGVKAFLAYFGCCPRVKSSAGKVYSYHLNRKSNKHIRTILFNAAKVLCIVSKQDSVLHSYARRVVGTKSHRSMKLAFSIMSAKIAKIIYALIRDNVAFSPDMGRYRAPAPVKSVGPLTITDKKLIRRARNLLNRVGGLEHLKLIAKNCSYFADALDRALQKYSSVV